MDISKLDVVKLSNEGYRCAIISPRTKEPTDLVITVKGSYASNFYEGAAAADTIEKTAALLARFTIGWDNLEENGHPVEFSLHDAERIYNKYPLIRSQVFTAINDIKNFTMD